MNFQPPQFEDMTDSQKMNIVSLAINDLQTKLSIIQTSLYGDGNGKIGALERLRMVEDFISNVKYWIRFMVGAILIQTIAFIITVVVALARIYPILVQLAAQTK